MGEKLYDLYAMTSKTASIFSNSKYFGKHILIVRGDVYAVNSAKEASRLFDKLVKDTGIIPTVTYVPKDQSLILICA